MTDKKLVFPPKFFKYDEETVEDMGYFFQRSDGRKISIVEVWESGSPIGKEIEVSKKTIQEIFKDKKLIEDQIEKSQLWKKMKKIYGDA